MKNKIIYYLKQLLPLSYYTTYYSDGNRYVSTWEQWFGQPYNINHYLICS